MDQYNLFINGQLVPPSTGKYFASINPATGSAWAQVADADQEDAERAIRAARQAFDSGVWSCLSREARGKHLLRISRLILKNADALARIEAQDVGKTIRHAKYIDVPTCAQTFESFGSEDAFLRRRSNPVAAPVRSWTVYDPIGVVACIIPWNYPLITFAWKVAPALAAGNTVVFKPSRLASASILRLAQIIQEADLPAGVLNIVTSTQKDVSACIVRHRDVDMISFTGGTQTGREIMSLAAQTPKKVSLELGGKSPNIVFADCHFEAAVGGALSAIFLNQGQMCAAGSRLLVEDKIYDRFVETLVARAKKLRIGDPMDETTEFGPLVSQEHRNRVLDFIAKGKAEGARLVCGGRIPEGPEFAQGFYLEPTIFCDVTNDMTIARQEIFGPVLSILKFSSLDQAIQISNDTDYGLAACVWTRNKDRANLLARKLRCGTVWVNTYGGFYDQAPFGGYKLSGIGRELGLEGMMEYVHPKHVCCDATPGGEPLVSRWFSPMDHRTVFVFMVTKFISTVKKILLWF